MEILLFRLWNLSGVQTVVAENEVVLRRAFLRESSFIANKYYDNELK